MVVTFCDDCKFVQLGMCDCSITIQFLVNNIRPYEAGLSFMDDRKIINATGKDDLGCGVETAITLTFQNCWTLKAFCGYASQTNVTIRGGNLAFTGCPASPPLEPVTNVTYIIANSTAAALLRSIELDMTKVKRYLTNKKSISGTTLTVFCDCCACVTTQSYTLDNACDPKSQTPI